MKKRQQKQQKQQKQHPVPRQTTQPPPNNVPNATHPWAPTAKQRGARAKPWITAAPNANVRIGGRTNKNTNG